jgi:hypothetical protein
MDKDGNCSKGEKKERDKFMKGIKKGKKGVEEVDMKYIIPR